MKDMIARLATHQTTPISTCNRNDHDEDTFYEDNLDDYDGSYDDDDELMTPSLFLSSCFTSSSHVVSRSQRAEI